jgi:hypothetical protein
MGKKKVYKMQDLPSDLSPNNEIESDPFYEFFDNGILISESHEGKIINEFQKEYKIYIEFLYIRGDTTGKITFKGPTYEVAIDRAIMFLRLIEYGSKILFTQTDC